MQFGTRYTGEYGPLANSIEVGKSIRIKPIPDFHTALDLTSHLGTHCECPYHHFEEGKSVGELPLTAFMGRAIYVNIDFLEPNAHIGAADLERACSKRIKAGDIVILDSPYRIEPFTPLTNTPEDPRLFVNAQTAWWLRGHQVKCVGFGDGVSIENCNEDVKPFHDIIMENDGVFLEVLKNLDQLKSDTFFMSYAPLPIVGADSCPVRAYAIEGIPGFGAE